MTARHAAEEGAEDDGNGNHTHAKHPSDAPRDTRGIHGGGDCSAAAAAAAAAAADVIFGDVCAICQEDVETRGRIDSCAHLFCLACVRRWAKIETRCPLCKARFSFIQPELMTSSKDATDEPGGRVTRSRTTPARRMKRIYLPHRDQVYEDPDGGELRGADVEEVLCVTCGDGGDEPHLMLCDGCDRGYHCYCVGLDAVPLDDWHCATCAAGDGRAEDENEGARRGNEDARHGAGAAAQTSCGGGGRVGEESDEAIAAALQRAEDESADRIARRAAGAAADRSSRAVCTGPLFTLPPAPNPIRLAPSRPQRRRDTSDDDGARERAPVHYVVNHSRGGRGRGRGGGGERVTGVDAGDAARRAQIARVAELRRMWEQYRAGQMPFPTLGKPEGETAERERVSGAMAAKRAARASVEGGKGEAAPEDDPWEMMRRATKEGNNGKAGRRAASPNATSGTGAARTLKRPTMRRVTRSRSRSRSRSPSRVSGPHVEPVTDWEWRGRRGFVPVTTAVMHDPYPHVAPRKSRVPPPVTANPPPPPPVAAALAAAMRTDANANAKRRQVAPGMAAAGWRPSGSRDSNSHRRLPTGISFSPPHAAAAASGWSDDSDDGGEGGGRGGPLDDILREVGASGRGATWRPRGRDEAPRGATNQPRAREQAPADNPSTSFVPAGAVLHYDPSRSGKGKVRASDPNVDKHAIAAMVRARLKPAYMRGALSKEAFKEVARAATQAAAAAVGAAALRRRRPNPGNDGTEVGADEGEDPAVDRAVQNALRNVGIAP